MLWKKRVVFQTTKRLSYIVSFKLFNLLFDCQISYDSIACDSHYIAWGFFLMGQLKVISL